MRSKKLSVLFCAVEELIDELGKIDDSKLHKIIDSLAISLRDSREFLDDPNVLIKPSQLVSGFEQGLLETSQTLVSLPELTRARSIKTFYSVVNKHIPELFDKQKEALSRIVSRGFVKNEKEWYLVRGRMDEVAGISGSETEFEVLDNLLLEYERIV